MGFYGNITNTAKTQFTFDRTYPNRRTMEARTATDEIYLGRYVLIEYDISNKQTLDTFNRVYLINSKFYTTNKPQEINRVKFTTEENPNNPGHGLNNAVIIGQMVYTLDETTEKQVFYKCINNDGSGNAVFQEVSYSESNYTQNYNIDINTYGEGRGYDSTVWQKIYHQGQEKFVMIAELNTVVPTFDISADAPSMAPILPHFDMDSTNVYYKLHWQPQWGLRVAAANEKIVDKSGNQILKSDETTIWAKEVYDPTTGRTSKQYYNAANEEWVTYTPQSNVNDYYVPSEADNVPAAIYFNAAALEAQVDEQRNTEIGLSKAVNDRDYITLLPTGKSGNQYPMHNGSSRTNDAVDIQEFRINLPSIGNTISAAWDVVHGPQRNNSPADSLQGRLNFFKEMYPQEIPVQSSGGYLVGSTVRGDSWIQPTVAVVNNNEYHQDAISIVHTFNEGVDTTSFSCKNGKEIAEDLTAGVNHSTDDTLKLYTPIVDEKGHIVAHNIETVTLPYGYKTFTPGEKSELTGEIESNQTPIIAEDTKDSLTITPGNKWIRLAGAVDELTVAHEVHSIEQDDKDSTDLDGIGSFTIQDLVFDEAGHVTANQKHLYQFPKAYRNITIGGASDSVEAGVSTDDTSMSALTYNGTFNINPQNRWVTLQAVADENIINIGHAAAGNETTTAGDTTASTPNFGDTFNVPYIKYDEMGHIASSNVRTVKIPQGSLTDTASTDTANVLTSIGFNETTGDITTTHQNVGTLKLTDYSSVNSVDTTFIQATDTINQAFNKIDSRFESLDLNDVASSDGSQIVYTVKQNNGQITVEHKKIGELILTDYKLPTAVSDDGKILATESLNTALGKIEFRINAEQARAIDAEQKLSQKIDDTIEGLDVDSIVADGYSFISEVSEANGKIAANTAYLENVKLKTAVPLTSSDNIAVDDTLSQALGKLQAQIDINETAIKTLNDGIDPNKIDSVKDLITYTEEHGETTQGILDAIGKKSAEGSSSTGIYALIDAETSARALADQGINQRIDNLVKVTNEQIEQWNAAEENVQADWTETDATKDSFILNKPTNLVTEDSPFTYRALTDKAGTEIAGSISITILTLLDKIAELEERVYALEHPDIQPPVEEPTPDGGEEEPPAE